jgi:hypothetical protein
MSSNIIINITDAARLMAIGKIAAFNEELYDVQLPERPGQTRQGGR